MNKSRLFFTILCLLSGSLASAQTVVTVPVGVLTYNLGANTTSAVSFPLDDASVYSGATTAFTTNTVTVSGATWTTNQFAVAGAPYFVRITSGNQVGRTILVLSNTSNGLTLDTLDTGLDASGFSLATGDTVDIFPGDTLGNLFGSTATAGVLSSGLQGGASAFTADGVQIYDGTSFVNYFFNTTLGNWVMTNGGATSQNNLILYPDDGLMIARRGATTTLSITGRVPATSLLTQIPSQTSIAVAVRFPKDTTLGGLSFTAPIGTSSTWVTGTSAFTADTISLWNGTKWVAYYENTSNQWIQVNGDGTDQSATVIPTGSAVFIGKRGTNTSGPSTFFTEALPYSLN